MLAFFSWDYWQDHALWLMFASAFLSATVLPASSEALFLALALSFNTTPTAQSSLLQLLMVATLGNTLGGFITYWLGRCLPPKNWEKQKKYSWALEKLYKYGNYALLFSWLPVVGDVLCALSGWLRLHWISAFIFIMIGKFLRYSFLLALTFFT